MSSLRKLSAQDMKSLSGGDYLTVYPNKTVYTPGNIPLKPAANDNYAPRKRRRRKK